jgi:hypothetical protein
MFVSPDSIVPEPGNPQSLNRYSYVGNRPTVYVDPTGHAHVCGTDADGGGCGEWSVYTHSIVENPLVVVDPELLERAQAVSAATKAEMQAGMAKASSETGRVAKSATKQAVRSTIKKSMPPVGVVNISTCGSIGVANYGTGCIAFVTADAQGNIVFFGITVGGGGSTGVVAAVTANYTWVFNAATVSDYEGWFANAGGSISFPVSGVPVTVGADYVGGRDTSGKELHGLQVNGGTATKSTFGLPGEIHGGATFTRFSPWRTNVYQLYNQIFGEW